MRTGAKTGEPIPKTNPDTLAGGLCLPAKTQERGYTMKHGMILAVILSLLLALCACTKTRQPTAPSTTAPVQSDTSGAASAPNETENSSAPVQESTSAAADTSVPATTAPATTAPATTAPATTAPATTAPATTAPATTAPATTVPATTVPATTVPVTTGSGDIEADY